MEEKGLIISFRSFYKVRYSVKLRIFWEQVTWKYFKEFDPSGYYPLVFAHENFFKLQPEG
jgi:hypothetical protein